MGTLAGTNLTLNNPVKAEDNTNDNKSEKIVITETNIFADIATRVDPAVVKITSHVETDEEMANPFFNDPFFKFFFRDQFPEQRPKTRTGYGSGFIVSENGYIVTNEHVIHNASKIEVTINNMEEPVSAEVAWAEYDLDLAIIEVDLNKKLPALELGDSNKIKPGDWSIAIGNPFGLQHTVTTGVISALGRPIQIPTNQGAPRSYKNLIQTDAAINPGNSGGPLLNIEGKVIGINTAVSMQGQGIGFAIPINEIKDYVNDLKTKGEIIRPWLGIHYVKITEDVQEYFQLENQRGVLVVEVIENSPADKAGVQVYDIIKELDEQTIKEIKDVEKIVSEKGIGERLLIKVIRQGSSEVLFARIERKPTKTYE